jgi:hypothetical protein
MAGRFAVVPPADRSQLCWGHFREDAAPIVLAMRPKSNDSERRGFVPGQLDKLAGFPVFYKVRLDDHASALPLFDFFPPRTMRSIFRNVDLSQRERRMKVLLMAGLAFVAGRGSFAA